MSTTDQGGHPIERHFFISGEEWSVWEDLQSVSAPSLVFENTKIARRVHAYPPNWRELSDEQLYTVSWSR
jgi:hypothetical protein